MDANCTKNNFGEFFRAKKTAAHYALMAITESSNKVSYSSNSKIECVDCGKLKYRIDVLTDEILNFKADLSQCQQSNDVLRANEKALKITIETLKKDTPECDQLKFRIKELTEENLNLKADVGPLQRSIDSLRQKEKSFLSTVENY